MNDNIKSGVPVHGCDDLIFMDDLLALEQVPEERIKQVHVGPCNMGFVGDQRFLRMMFAEEGESSKPFNLVFDEKCAAKIAVAICHMVSDEEKKRMISMLGET